MTNIGGTWAMTRKTLRQAVKALAQALDDPRYDDWDDTMILRVLSEIINTHRETRDEITFNLTGNTVLSDEDLRDFTNRVARGIRPDPKDNHW